MVAATSVRDEERDQRVYLSSKSFREYEALLRIRGERSSPRISYLDGTIELMSPSMDHEAIKSLLGRLVEAFAEERDIDLNSYGSWTLKRRPEEAGAEPDECYIVGTVKKRVPDLAIEVAWTRGGIDKLEIYRRLGVREVWMWSANKGLEVHALRGARYQRISRSELIPEIELTALARLALSPNHTRAVREYRASLKRGSGAAR